MTTKTIDPALRRLAVGWLPVLAAILLGGAMVGCSGSASGGAAWTHAPGGSPTADTAGGHAMPGPMGGMHSADQGESAWNGRPDYVRAAAPRTVEAYAYALARGDVLEYMPCYCGCVGMGHRSNLDCYFKPHSIGSVPQFEEHASYCKVCVDIALRAKGMQADGRSLVDIRRAVDAEFGALAPGTETELPPAGS